MMNHMKMATGAKLLALALALGLSGCKDDSTWDSKEYSFGQYKLETVSPGDDFFMYCNGKYWNETQIEKGKMVSMNDEAQKLRDEHYNMSQPAGPLSAKIREKYQQYEAGEQADNTAAIARLKEMLAVVDGIRDRETLASAIAQLIKEGANLPIETAAAPLSRTASFGMATIVEGIYHPTGCRSFLQMLGLSEADAEENVSRATELYEAIKANNSDTDQEAGESLPERLARMAALYAETPATRSGDTSLYDRIAAHLGVDSKYVYVVEDTRKDFAPLEEADTEDVKALLRCHIAYDCIFLNRAGREAFLSDIAQARGADDSLAQKIAAGMRNYIDKKFDYAICYEWTNKYITDNDRDIVMDYCEEMRQAFLKRIDKLDWMSGTTKQKAKEKLLNMHFNIAHSEEWNKEALPELDGQTLTENLMEMRSRRARAITGYAGKEVYKQMCDITILNGDEEFSFLDFNAFYNLTTNGLVILPSMILYPMFDVNYSDAVNYAFLLGSTVGHEMTHGFDSEGAKYDKDGNIKNWWTPADKMEFEDRCGLLVRCHNNLEVLPDEAPNVFSKGEQTLTENIADLGGMLIAYDAYMARLDKEGYSGESLDAQRRKFFESFAESWRSKYDYLVWNYMMNEDNDVHSFPKERVNGTVMNMDAWYSLYQVKRGNALYLPENRRARIW